MSSDGAASPSSRSAELRSAGLKVGAAIVVGAGLLALYAHEVRVESRVKEILAGPAGAQGQRLGGAQAQLAKDTPAGWSAAEAGLEQALELQPSNPYALAALAAVEQRLLSDGVGDRASKAEQALARVEAKEVARPERYEARALALIRAGRAVDAENYLRPLVEKFGGYWELWDALGRAQRAGGKLQDAKASLRKAMESGWRSPRAVADYAELVLQEGGAGEASAVFDRALQAGGDHLRSFVGKSRALLALSAAGRGADPKAAKKWADDVLERPAAEVSPALKSGALAARSEAQLQLGDKRAALADADASLAALSANAAGLRARALALTADDGQRANAYPAFKEAVAKDPYDPSLYFDGAAALAAHGQPELGEKLLGAYAALLPKTARYSLALARLASQKGDLAAAAAALAAAEGQVEVTESATRANIAFEQGRLAQKKGDHKAAKAAYERALSLRDDQPEVYRQVASLFLAEGDADGALNAYTEALRRYRAARTPDWQLEAFYAEVESQLGKARQQKRASAWLKDARAVAQAQR